MRHAAMRVDPLPRAIDGVYSSVAPFGWVPVIELKGDAMKGRVLDYSVQSNTGVISGVDGGRYSFDGSEWRGDRPPSRGQSVDFAGESETALQVFPALDATSASKSKGTAGILALLLGGWGLHKFYLGFTGAGLVFLLTNTVGLLVTWIVFFVPNIILGFVAFVEGILYLTKSDEEFEETYVVKRRQWF